VSSTQFRSMCELSLVAIIMSGFIGAFPLFNGTIIPFLIVCGQGIIFMVCILVTVRVWKQQKRRQEA